MTEMKCYMGYTACRWISLLIEKHINSSLNSAGCYSQPYGYVDRYGVFNTDHRLLRLDRLIEAHRRHENRGRPKAALNDPIYGHLEKHLLKMKWERIRERCR